MRSALAIGIFWASCFSFSCEQQKCQAPPPAYKLAFINPQGQSVITNSSQANAVRLLEVSSTGVPRKIPQSDFKPVPSNEGYQFIYNVGYDLFAKAEQTQYTVEIDNTVIGTLSLTSRRNESKCDGWMHITQVRFNAQPVGLSADNITYAINVNP